jgi:MoxR-like ATPase
VRKILSPQDIFGIRELINRVTVSASLENYIIELIFATRFPADYGLKDEANYILYVIF